MSKEKLNEVLAELEEVTGKTYSTFLLDDGTYSIGTHDKQNVYHACTTKNLQDSIVFYEGYLRGYGNCLYDLGQ